VEKSDIIFIKLPTQKLGCVSTHHFAMRKMMLKLVSRRRIICILHIAYVK
jgi:hypothetical protein